MTQLHLHVALLDTAKPWSRYRTNAREALVGKSSQNKGMTELNNIGKNGWGLRKQRQQRLLKAVGIKLCTDHRKMADRGRDLFIFLRCGKELYYLGNVINLSLS